MTTADLTPAARKAEVRSRIRELRRLRSTADREHAAGTLAARALPLLSDCSLVACYSSMPAEPGTAALIDLLRQREIRVLLPRVVGTSMEWVELTDATALQRSTLGILEPAGEPAVMSLVDCDAIVLPALAVAAGGIRLGQGGGFYDRALEAVPTHSDGGPARLALLFDGELLESLPHEPHDTRVDYVVVPEGVTSF